MEVHKTGGMAAKHDNEGEEKNTSCAGGQRSTGMNEIVESEQGSSEGPGKCSAAVEMEGPEGDCDKKKGV